MTASSLYRIPAPSPGRLTTMPRPRGGDRLDDEIRALRAAGIDDLVCLLTRDEQVELDLIDEPDAAARAGIRFHGFPIVDFAVPAHGQVAPLVRTLAGRMRDGRHVAIHCRGGVGRSSLVAAAVLTAIGTPVGEVWEIIGRARGTVVPETDEQRQWIFDHVRHA